MILKAFAKLNLSLAITGVRADGYHELDTVMQSISLFDTVKIEKSDSLSVRMDKEYAEEKHNTAYRAAEAFLERTGAGGAYIDIEKRIPAMSGLGGASADAAAVLYGLDSLYATGLSPAELRILARKVGADVPFALIGGLARAKGIGDILTPLELKNPLYFTVVKPYQGVSTAEAFKRYHGSAHISIDTVEYALQKGDLPLFYKHAGNALGVAALGVAPDIIKAANALKNAGAPEALMTGSGSAMFTVFETEEEAKRVAENIKEDFELCGVFQSVRFGIEETNEPF